MTPFPLPDKYKDTPVEDLPPGLRLRLEETDLPMAGPVVLAIVEEES